MTKEIRNPNDESRTCGWAGTGSTFGLCHSFDIRHSGFVIVQSLLPPSQCSDDRLPKNRHNGNWNTIVRLAPGVTWSMAQLQLDALNARLAADDPFAEVVKKAGYRTRVVSLRDDHVRQVKRTLLLLRAGVSVLLVIGVVNLPNLLLIRANGRLQEIAVRSALGAGRWQIARGVIVEIMALVTAAAMAGLWLCAGGLRLLSTLLFDVGTFPPGIVILVGLTLVGIVSLAILIPSRRAAKVDPMEALRCE